MRQRLIVSLDADRSRAVEHGLKVEQIFFCEVALALQNLPQRLGTVLFALSQRKICRIAPCDAVRLLRQTLLLCLFCLDARDFRGDILAHVL